MVVRAIRGAVQIDADTRESVLKGTTALLKSMFESNRIENQQLISILFTATPDITSEFPALAARELGIGDVPLLCFVEMNVVGSMPRVIRVMVNADLDIPRSQIQHVYLGGAKALRLDIAQ